MEMSKWQTERGKEDPYLIDQYQLDNFVNAFGENYEHSCFSESLFPYPIYDLSPLELGPTPTCSESRPKKRDSTGSWNFTLQQVSSSNGSSSPNMLSFVNSNSPIHPQYYVTSDCIRPKEKVRISHGAYKNQIYSPQACQGIKGAISSGTSQPSYSRGNMMAERKRREKLTERFIALSAVVPGLKKMDKASILENCIRYVKELQETVTTLERQTAKKPIESSVFVKKFQIPLDNDSSSTDVTSTNSSNEVQPVPEIETRVSDRGVLIRIHCEKQKGAMIKALAEIEKLNLSIVSSNMMPFGNSTVEINVVAEMDGAFNMAATDLLTELRLSLLQFM